MNKALTEEEIKELCFQLVKSQAVKSGGCSGFSLLELLPYFDELEKERRIKKRQSINRSLYFLK